MSRDLQMNITNYQYFCALISTLFAGVALGVSIASLLVKEVKYEKPRKIN
jgi:hypothetical protein